MPGTLNPADTPWFRVVYDPHAEGLGADVAIDTLNDRGARGLGLDLTAAGSARPTNKTNQINGQAVARFDGAGNVLSGASAANWVWLHDYHPKTIVCVFRTATFDPNALMFLCATSESAASNTRGFSLSLDDRAASSRFNRVVLAHTRGTDDLAVDFLSTNDYAFNSLQWNLLTVRYFGGARSLHDILTSARRARIAVNGVDCAMTDLLTPTILWNDAANPVTPLLVGASGATLADYFAGDLAYLAIADNYLDNAMTRATERYLQERFALPWSGGLLTDAQAFSVVPTVERLQDGTLYAEFARRNRDEITESEGFVSVRSGDRGRTWSFPTHQKLTPGKTDQNLDLLRTQAGTLIRSWCQWHGGSGFPTSFDIVVNRSTDDGYTWSNDILVESGIAGDFHQPLGLAQFASGKLILGVYGRVNGAGRYLVRAVFSTDDGVTWGNDVAVASNGSLDFIEPCPVALSGQNGIMFFRDNTNFNAPTIRYCTTTNEGTTWSAVSTLLSTGTNIAGYGGTPRCLRASSGVLYVMARPVLTAGNKYERYILRWSDDDGATWSTKDYWALGLNGNAALADLIELEPGVLLFLSSNAPDNVVVGGNPSTLELVQSVILYEADIQLIT